jgi:type I restriction enzyme S subunit
MARVDLSPVEVETVLRILARHVPDREVWVFGSRACGTSKEYSDLDLAIVGDSPLPLSVLAALESEFEESDLRFKVDLVDWAVAAESFRRVIRDQRVPLRPVEDGDSPKRGGAATD